MDIQFSDGGMALRFALFVLAALTVTGRVATASLLDPVVLNSGFEETQPGNSAPGWGWNSNEQAGYVSSTDAPHSGTRCLMLTNNTPVAFWIFTQIFQDVPVVANMPYEFSAWVRGEGVGGDCSLGGGPIPSGTYGWRRISCIMKTSDYAGTMRLTFSVPDKTKALYIDYVSLRPIGIPISGKGVNGLCLVPTAVTGDDTKEYLGFKLDCAGAGAVDAVIGDGKDALFKNRSEVKPGTDEIEWEWSTGKTQARSS